MNTYTVHNPMISFYLFDLAENRDYGAACEADSRQLRKSSEQNSALVAC